MLSEKLVSTENLWKHQKLGLAYLSSRNSGILLHGVGTGKTRTTFNFVLERKFKLILVIGTKNSLYVWKKESEKLGNPIDVSVSSVGSVKNRAHYLKNQYSATKDEPKPLMFVINYEALIKAPMQRVLKMLPFDCIIFDEVHRLRGHNTKQSKSAYWLAQAHPKAFRLGLTGTLIYNKPLDVFGIFRFIDPLVFGVSWTSFKNQYAVWAGQYGQIPVKFINQDLLKNKVLSNSHIVDRHEALDLPDEQHLTINLSFDKTESKVYNEFNKEFVASLNEKIIVAKNVLDKVTKLQELTAGFIYQDGVQHFSNLKSSALEDLLEEIDQDVVVFYKFKTSLQYIQKATGEKKCYSINGDHSDYVEWSADLQPSVIAVQLQSGSEGIDLSKAGIAIFYDLTYSYGQYEQALGRISRGDSRTVYNRSHVLYYYLIIEKTIDSRIWKALNSRKDLIEELLREDHEDTDRVS